jgi:NADH-quinone oxidoreductase subunit E
MSETIYHLTENEKRKIDAWLQKFPADQKRSALLPALHIVQEHAGYISEEAMRAVARYLDLPYIQVYEVATFYTMYDLKPTAKHKISICTNISCMLRGAQDIATHVKKCLGVSACHEMSADGKFVVEEVECLAACCNAPMMQIDKTYYEDLTLEKVDTILKSFE